MHKTEIKLYKYSRVPNNRAYMLIILGKIFQPCVLIQSILKYLWKLKIIGQLETLVANLFVQFDSKDL